MHLSVSIPSPLLFSPENTDNAHSFSPSPGVVSVCLSMGAQLDFFFRCVCVCVCVCMCGGGVWSKIAASSPWPSGPGVTQNQTVCVWVCQKGSEFAPWLAEMMVIAWHLETGLNRRTICVRSCHIWASAGLLLLSLRNRIFMHRWHPLERVCVCVSAVWSNRLFFFRPNLYSLFSPSGIIGCSRRALDKTATDQFPQV